MAGEIRRGAESPRVQGTGSGPADQHGRRIPEAAFRAESCFQRFDVLVEGINEMTLELKRLREDAAVLRKVLSTCSGPRAKSRSSRRSVSPPSHGWTGSVFATALSPQLRLPQCDE